LLVLDEFVIDLIRKKSHHQDDDTDLDPEEAALDLAIDVRVQEMEVAEVAAMNVLTEHDIVSP